MRKLLLGTVFASAALLAGCSGGITFPTLTLANVQAQAAAVDAGIDAAAVLAEADTALSSVVVSQIKTSVAAFDSITSQFEGLTPAENAATLAEKFTTAAEGVVAVLPIDPATKAAIELGLAIVSAFASGATTSPVPATVTTTPVTGTSSATLHGAPIISIPAPRFVPVA